MDKTVLESKIKARGREFFASIRGETPSIFNKDWWTGKVMDWSMHNENFKLQLFRFVDVLPYLTTTESLTNHLAEYFGSDEQEIPAVLRWGAKATGPGGKFTANLIAGTVRKNIEAMARQFIIGEDLPTAVKTINKLRHDGFAFTVDILGEAALSDKEAATYGVNYLTLLDVLHKEQGKWPLLDAGGSVMDWGHAPKINVAIKPTSLYSQANPADRESSVQGIYRGFLPLVRKAKEVGAFVCIDMEQYRFKDITLEVYRRLRATPEFIDYPHLGVVLQAYLRDTDQDLDNLLAWAKANGLPISIRLVKGAYWDYETILAQQNGWQVPVYTGKPESDAAFERMAALILKNHEICHLACASHNIRSIAAVMEIAADLHVPAERYEFQVLFGMAEPVRRGLLDVAGRVRLYCPYGELLPGMGYLVRRLLENTANESFLRQSFAEHTDIDRLLESPAMLCQALAADARIAAPSGKEGPEPDIEAFQNEPQADFTRPEVRKSFSEAIGSVSEKFGKTWPLIIGGQQVTTADRLSSVNPAKPDESVGYVCQAGKDEIDLAIAAAGEAQPGWEKTPAAERAQLLFRAAEIMRENIYELAAWQVLEVGKQWSQAHGDVTEAIDFLEYYGREMIRLSIPRRLGGAPGEINLYCYQPKGLAAVIAPWNFPLAISCGMTAAALVTGNTVLYKPSGLSAVIGSKLTEIYRQAGIPAGVFNFVPCRGSTVGDYLVEHPAINIIAFTGSVEVGQRIAEHAGKMRPGQLQIKKVIAEMGGKNGIIVDDDADLDVAVPHILASAFGYQGQKCSACSRVIVVRSIYEKFTARLVEAAKSLKIGPAADPANFMGPVVDGAARKKILEYIDIAGSEGSILLSQPIPEDGYYVPLTIVADIETDHRTAREEIFGPVLALMKAPDFSTAIDMANSTFFALTGGVFSRSPRHLEMARESFKVGNLYLNRGITGALVERQPFGGFRMSGIGSKAGGPDYLLQFMDPVTVTENTMRRGFAPAE
jgi:RHH-type proline utilization regulon transcriptional repressor/proline dehydrogenase/delta 1-pyrroline-5-carboxylate dehydrogenase